MHTMSCKEDSAKENFKASPHMTSLHHQNEVALRRAISDVSHQIDTHWNIVDTNENSEDAVKTDDQALNQVKCECCGLEEDCSLSYITKIKNSYSGKWVCGLCSDVMEETAVRSPGTTVNEAMSSHRATCQEFHNTRLNPQLSLTSTMKDFAKRITENRMNLELPPLSKPRLSRTSSCAPNFNLNSARK